MSGTEAVRRRFANEAVPIGELEKRTMNFAERVAKIPSDLLAFNKKSVHRAFEAQGMRTNLRNGVDLEALMFKASGAKMLTARRGPQQQKNQVRALVPRPAAAIHVPAVAAQEVSATMESKTSKSNNNPRSKQELDKPTKPALALTKKASSPAIQESPSKTAPVKQPTVAASPLSTKPSTTKASITSEQAPSTPTKSATNKAAPEAPTTTAKDEGIHLHLHEAVHIHFSPSKL